jgi:thiosulfate dehydrogenase [quinone] large subunit
MTRQRTYILTVIAAAMYVFLTWSSADNLWDTGNLWDSETYSASTIFTYLLFAGIFVAGYLQARRLPAEGVEITTTSETSAGQTDDPVFWKLLLGNAYYAILWLPLRFFIGQEWTAAGEHKMRDSAWMDGGTALQGYWQRATTVPEGRPTSPAGTYGWFEDFLKYMLNHEWYTWFAKLIAVGEFLVGIGLIVGALVGIAAFFGTLMNFNFMLAGSASSNPVLFGISVFLVLGWKVAGFIGLDRYIVPAVGAPWKLGKVFKGHAGEPLIGGHHDGKVHPA